MEKLINFLKKVIDNETKLCYYYPAGETKAGRRTKKQNISPAA